MWGIFFLVADLWSVGHQGPCYALAANKHCDFCELMGVAAARKFPWRYEMNELRRASCCLLGVLPRFVMSFCSALWAALDDVRPLKAALGSTELMPVASPSHGYGGAATVGHAGICRLQA